MPARKRVKTKYLGVYYVLGRSKVEFAKPERIYYIRYRRNGRNFEEKVGRQFQDGMTPAKARRIRIEYLEGKRLPRRRLLCKAGDKNQIAKASGSEVPEKENNSEKLFKERWLLFMQSATDGFCFLDSNLNLIELNDAGMRILPDGIRKEDVIGKNLLDLLPHMKETGEYDQFRRVVQTGTPFVHRRAIGAETTFRMRDSVAPQRFAQDTHVSYKAFKVGEGVGVIMTDISDSKRKEKELEKRKAELQHKANELEEANTALKVLLKRREKDKIDIEKNVVLNFRELVQPYLEKLKSERLGDRGKSYVEMIESNLNHIVSPLIRSLSTSYFKFTYSEIQIANLVKHGKTTKEIADLLGLSINTIEGYRKRIRKKLGIKNQETNLRTYLSSLE